MDDGITIPPRPAGHDFRVQLLHIGTAIVPADDHVRRWKPRRLTIRGARSADKARLQALAGVGAGWRIETITALDG